MRGSIRDLQNIRTGISNYLKTLARSANPDVPNNLLVCDSYLLNFYMKLMAYITRSEFFRKTKNKSSTLPNTSHLNFTNHVVRNVL